MYCIGENLIKPKNEAKWEEILEMYNLESSSRI